MYGANLLSERQASLALFYQKRLQHCTNREEFKDILLSCLKRDLGLDMVAWHVGNNRYQLKERQLCSDYTASEEATANEWKAWLPKHPLARLLLENNRHSICAQIEDIPYISSELGTMPFERTEIYNEYIKPNNIPKYQGALRCPFVLDEAFAVGVCRFKRKFSDSEFALVRIISNFANHTYQRQRFSNAKLTPECISSLEELQRYATTIVLGIKAFEARENLHFTSSEIAVLLGWLKYSQKDELAHSLRIRGRTLDSHIRSIYRKALPRNSPSSSPQAILHHLFQLGLEVKIEI